MSEWGNRSLIAISALRPLRYNLGYWVTSVQTGGTPEGESVMRLAKSLAVFIMAHNT
jgi:hypothetical protein